MIFRLRLQIKSACSPDSGLLPPTSVSDQRCEVDFRCSRRGERMTRVAGDARSASLSIFDNSFEFTELAAGRKLANLSRRTEVDRV